MRKTSSIKSWLVALLVICFLGSTYAIAQESGAGPDEIPYDTTVRGTSEPKSTTEPLPSSPPPPTSSPSSPTAPIPTSSAPKKSRAAELSGLGTLAPFNDIAVISKRFLPKTHRFEISPNFGFIINDAFFNNINFSGRLAYYLTEQYGVEATGIFLSTSDKNVTETLANERLIGTASLATPKSYYGLAFKWVPIYGKMGLLNKSIVPFDTYFLAGGGITQTNQSSSPPTLHLGTGQLYAINKWLAARWDFSFFVYKTDTTVTNRPGGSYTNLHITIGMSLFLPGAEYR